MIFDALRICAFVVICCALALFVQAIMLARSFRPLRQHRWKILFAALPLGVGLWSLAVAGQAIEASYMIPLLTHLHMTFAFWLSIIARCQAVIDRCALQICLMALTFTLTLLIKRWLLRRKSRVLAWEIAQQMRMGM